MEKKKIIIENDQLIENSLEEIFFEGSPLKEEGVEDKEALKTFIRKSTKYYEWNGNQKNFNIFKGVIIALWVLTILLGIGATVLMSILINLYQFVLFFENVYLIFIFKVIADLRYIKHEYLDIDLAALSRIKYIKNKDELMVPSKRVKIPFLLFSLSFALGAPVALFMVYHLTSLPMFILSVVIEGCFILFSLITYVLSIIFYAKFKVIHMRGYNENKTDFIILVYNPKFNKINYISSKKV